MSAESPPTLWSARDYLLFLLAVIGVSALVVALGAAVAGARADGSLPAILAAAGVTALASAVSGVVSAYSGGAPTSVLTRALLAMLIRLGLVAVLGAVCVLALGVARGPFLIWLVVAYLALLAVDTGFSIRASKRPS